MGPLLETDLLVVGGGTAGIVASKTTASLGGNVLLVERERTGGECLWTGCVPSKALLAAAAASAAARNASRLGVHADVRVDFPAVMDHVRFAIHRIEPDDSPAALRNAGVTVETGDFAFTGAHRGTLDGRPVRFGQAIIATGSVSAIPPIPGLGDVEYLTSDTVWELEALPMQLAVLGGGNIGCELGQAFARLGSDVTIVEATDRLLPREDHAASQLVTDSVADDGVKVLTGAPVTHVLPAHDDEMRRAGLGRLVLGSGAEVSFTHLLIAVGRTSRTEALNTDAAGVGLDDRGSVRVDRRLQTTNPRIWAAGDVTGNPQFTHLAGVHGSIAATNATLGLRRRIDPTVPRVTFTHPEVASVGVSTGNPPGGVRVLSWLLDHTDRAIAEGETEGFTKLAVDAKGRILGATVVGPRAGEALAELTLAVRNGLRTRDLAGTTHPYPTYADAGWNASIADVRESLAKPGYARVIGTLAMARRRWVQMR